MIAFLGNRFVQFLGGVVLGALGAVLVARNNAAKAKALVDKAASISKI